MYILFRVAIFDRDQESLRTKTCNNLIQNQDILFNFRISIVFKCLLIFQNHYIK